MAYATRDDVFMLGLNAQAFVVRPRPVTSSDVDIATGVIRLEAHGLASDDVITMRVTSGGSLPAELSAFVPYRPSVVSFDLLRIINPATGTAFTSFTSTGSGWSVVVDPLRRLDRHIEDAAAIIDDKLTAHSPPVELDPAGFSILTGLNARLAAMSAVGSLQFDNAAYRVAVDRLEASLAKDWENLATYLKGRPINPRPTDQTNVADNSARAGASTTASQWTTGYL